LKARFPLQGSRALIICHRFVIKFSLFARYATAGDYAAADQAELERQDGNHRLVSREGHRAPEQDRSVLPAGQEPVGVAGVNVAAHQPAGSLTPW
jgi:hypothetical protein